MGSDHAIFIKRSIWGYNSLNRLMRKRRSDNTASPRVTAGQALPKSTYFWFKFNFHIFVSLLLDLCSDWDPIPARLLGKQPFSVGNWGRKARCM